MFCISSWSTQRNIISYLLIFGTPIQSPSTQYTSHFYLLWKVGRWVVENLNFKNHSLMIRNKIHLLSQEKLPSHSIISCVPCLLYSFFCLLVIHFHPSCSALSVTHPRMRERERQATALSTNSVTLARSVTL